MRVGVGAAATPNDRMQDVTGCGALSPIYMAFERPMQPAGNGASGKNITTACRSVLRGLIARKSLRSLTGR